MTTIDRYFVRRLAVATIAVTAGFSGPIILVSLINQFPLIAVSTTLLWPALYGISCMILLHSMPALVPGAIIWVYGQFLADGTIVTMYMAGRSAFAVKMPAIIVSLIAVAAGYGLSCHFAPDSAKYIHDLLFVLRKDLSPDLLEAGKFNQIGRDGQVIFFERKVDGNRIAKVFIRQVESDDEQNTSVERTYIAEHGFFQGIQGSRWVVLTEGTLFITKNEDDIRKVDFREFYWHPTAYFGGNTVRHYKIFDEMTTTEFLESRDAAMAEPRPAREWVREAAKRFLVPLLALIHTVFGLALLTLFGAMTERRGYITSLLNGLVILLHALIIILIEIVGQLHASLIWAVAALLCLELGAAILMMTAGPRYLLQSYLDNLELPRIRLFERIELFFSDRAADTPSR